MACTAKSKTTMSVKQLSSRQHRRYRRRSKSPKESGSLSGTAASRDAESPRSSQSSEDTKSLQRPEIPGAEESKPAKAPRWQEQWPAIPGAEEPKPAKAPKWPVLRYGNGLCERCRKLAHIKLRPMPDDDDYVYPSDDFDGDEELRLRVIHHRRKKWLTGCFDADCHPYYLMYGGPLLHRDHFLRRRQFDKKVFRCIQFAIKTYKEKKGVDLVLLDILNVTAEPNSSTVFYVTFEALNPFPQGNETFVDVYQTAVTSAAWYIGQHEVLVFRKKVNGKDEHLLPPDPFYENLTRVKKNSQG